MLSASFGPQTNQCRQTRLTGPWGTCDSIRPEHALDTLASIGSTIKTCRTTTTKPNVMNMANYPSVYFSSAVGGLFPIFLAIALLKSNPSGTFGFSGN